ncbi:MAG: hypothetical protein K6F61_07740 [Clostridiales bacterium]|nr:hypothetical protein [Clostridiales bacterium]
MKKNEKTIRSAMDARLSFLDELPSCRAAVLCRIAQEEEPVMKRKISLGLVFAIVLVLLAAAALATTLLLSPRADAVRTADRALEEKYGITAEMQTFFARSQEEAQDGTVTVTYAGAGGMEYPLGTYTAVVRDGKAEITWSHDGEDTSGGYDSEIWGLDQLKAMVQDGQDEQRKLAFLDRAAEITEAHIEPVEYTEPTDAEVEAYYEKREEDKTAAMQSRKLTEDEMIAAGREFIISNWNLNEEQISRLELYTNSTPKYLYLIGIDPEEANNENEWYEMVNGKPCFKVEYLLYQPLTAEQMENGEEREYREGDGYYNVFVNVETGEIEDFEYNNGLGGLG